jgi:hypothetical protein
MAYEFDDKSAVVGIPVTELPGPHEWTENETCLFDVKRILLGDGKESSE